AVVVVAIVGIVPAVLGHLGLDGRGGLVTTVRYLLLAVVLMYGLVLVYRYAPNRDEPLVSRRISPGTVVAGIVWLGATAAFDMYAARFGNYQDTYGALGGVILLLMWLFISSFAVLLGAEIDSTLEAQIKDPHDENSPHPA